MNIRQWRRVWVPAIILLTLLVPAIGVGAHAEYRSSDPASGGAVAQAPDKVTVIFSAETSPTRSSGTVSDSTGLIVSMGGVVDLNKRDTMTIGLRPGLPKGVYTVKWTSVADDGHTAKGSFDFTVTAGGTTASSTDSSTTQSGLTAFPWWGWILGFFGVTAAVLVLAYFLQGRGARPDANAPESPLT